jgi:hypothetical protein
MPHSYTSLSVEHVIIFSWKKNEWVCAQMIYYEKEIQAQDLSQKPQKVQQ